MKFRKIRKDAQDSHRHHLRLVDAALLQQVTTRAQFLLCSLHLTLVSLDFTYYCVVRIMLVYAEIGYSQTAGSEVTFPGQAAGAFAKQSFLHSR